MPLAVDHFRYFAGVLRGQEGTAREIDENTVAYHFHEPLGVVGQIIPWNFPILMAAWKLAPALAAGNCVVLKPAEQTPWSILKVLSSSSATCCPRAWSTSSTASASRPVSRSRPARASPRSRSPARRRPAASSCSTRRRTSSRSPSSSAASRPNVFFDDVARRAATPSTTRRSRASRCSPSTRARCARAPRARWSSASIYDRLPRRRGSTASSRSCRATRSTRTR